MQHSGSVSREADPPNLPLKALARAQFYYLDRFVLAASLHQLLLYKFALDDEVDDVRRYAVNRSAACLVGVVFLVDLFIFHASFLFFFLPLSLVSFSLFGISWRYLTDQLSVATS